MSNSEIVRQHNVGHESVRRWRTRWQASTAQFEEIESSPAVENEQARMDDLEELIYPARDSSAVLAADQS